MSDQNDDTTPVQPASTEVQPTPPKTARTWKTWQLVTAAVIALLLGIGIGGAGASSEEDAEEASATSEAEDEDGEEPERTTTTERERTTTTVRRTTTTTEGPYYPAPADFELTVVVTEQSCFGSAGCNINYDVELAYVGPRPLDESSSFQLIYEVRGGEETKIGNIETDGTQYSRPSDFISTGPNPKLEAVVTAVRER